MLYAVDTEPLCESLTEYRFPCGRWLGKGVDDGAIERLLVAEQVPSTIDANGRFCCCMPGYYLLLVNISISKIHIIRNLSVSF